MGLAHGSGDIKFLIPEIDIPIASSRVRLPRAPVVSVNADAVFVDGQRITGPNMLTSPYVSDMSALEDAMSEKHRHIEESAQLLGIRQVEGIVIFQVDRKVPFASLRSVITACGAAGFHEIRFAVVREIQQAHRMLAWRLGGALRCTAFGLSTGILALVCFGLLRARTERMVADANEVSVTVANLLATNRQKLLARSS
jgi:hypothetical protein